VSFLSRDLISVFVVQKSLSSKKRKKWIKQARYGRKKQEIKGQEVEKRRTNDDISK
jgi:hypothetical protein